MKELTKEQMKTAQRIISRIMEMDSWLIIDHRVNFKTRELEIEVRNETLMLQFSDLTGIKFIKMGNTFFFPLN